MGFDGLPSTTLHVDSSGASLSIAHYYWDAGSSHRVKVVFNASGRATSKSLQGGFPGMITLDKYNRIVVGRTTGVSKTEIDRIMGFEGSYTSRNVATNTQSYRWAESADTFVEVDFLISNSDRAVAARASGLPGAKAKP